MLDNVAGDRDHHRRDAAFFEMPGNQAHGLMADRSYRHQDGDIDAVLAGDVPVAVENVR